MTSPAFASITTWVRFAAKLSICTLRVGAKRSISVFQLGATEAGATTSEGPSSFFSSKNAMVCTVLPRPMSSASNAPAPQLLRRAIHRKPSR